MSVTMETIAKESGVCRETVSFVFNNKWKEKRISRKTKDRVLSIAEKYHYLPSSIGRDLVTKKTHTIGIALYEIDYICSSTYFITIIAGMEEITGYYDYNIQFATTRRTNMRHNQNLFFLRKVKEKRIDGLIIIDQYVSNEDILILQELKTPFVLIDKQANGIKANCVLIDHKNGMYQATEHLIKMGHKRIGFLCAPFYTGEEELKGYNLALTQNGLIYDPDLIWKMEDVKHVVEKGVSYLLSLNQPPTAILTSDDIRATEAMNVLRAKGVKVPEDIAVIGFNDLSIAKLMSLTTVRVPLREMGEKAIEMLLNIINRKEIEEPEIVLKPELVIRDSCGFRKKSTTLIT